MHNASTKQRVAALRRRLGIFTGWQPRWVRDRRRRLERLERLALAAGGGRIAPEEPARVDEAPTEIGTARLPQPARAAASPDPEPERVPAPPTAAALAPPCPTAAAPAPQPRTAAAPPPTVAEPARTTHATPPTPPCAGPARPPRPAAALVATAGRREGGVARGAGVAGAVLVLFAALLLALGRRGPDAPLAPAGVERAPSRDPVVVAALAPSPGPGPAAAPRGADLPGAPDPSIVEVRPGDTLWHLAAVHLGDPLRWPELHAANARLVRDPDLIFPGQRLDVPPRSARL